MAADRTESDLKALLDCKICNKQLNDPRSLPCLHSYCCACLENTVTGNVISCLVCEEAVEIATTVTEQLPVDFLAVEVLKNEELIQKFKSETNFSFCKCCGGEKTVVSFCSECDSMLCAQCDELHQKLSPLKHHKCIRSELALTTHKRWMSKTSPPRCDAHWDQILHILCFTCDGILVCPACAMLNHQNHKLGGVKDAAEQMSTDLTLIREKIEKLNGKWEDYRKEIEEWKQNNINELTAVAEAIHQTHDQKRGKMQQECEDTKQNLRARIKEKIKKLEEELEVGIQEADTQLSLKLTSLAQAKDDTMQDLAILKTNYEAFWMDLEKRVKMTLTRSSDNTTVAKLSVTELSEYKKVQYLQRVTDSLGVLHQKLEAGIPDVDEMKSSGGRKRELALVPSDEDTIIGNLSRPGKPGQPQAVEILHNALKLQWAAPANAGSDTRYIVEQKIVGCSEWSIISGAVNELAYSVAELIEPGQQYQFRVAAVVIPDGLYGPKSDESMVIPFPGELGKPGKPKVIMFSGNSVTLHWIEANHPAFMQCVYSIDQKLDGSAEWTSVGKDIKKTYYKVDRNLIRGSKYTYRVMASFAGIQCPNTVSEESDIVPFPFDDVSVLVGVNVVRGPDWDLESLENQDGNGAGTVTRQEESRAGVYVKWFNNNKEGESWYYMGHNSSYELQLAEEF